LQNARLTGGVPLVPACNQGNQCRPSGSSDKLGANDEIAK
jgi:hypothetical protein